MLFLTILLLSFSLLTLLKGSLFKGLRMESLEENIKKTQQGTDNYKPENYGLVIKALLLLGFTVVYLTTTLIYITNAIQIDPFYYPSMAALIYYIMAFLFGLIFYRKTDLSTEAKIEKARNKAKRNRTLKGTLVALLWTSYYAYMAYSLITL